MRQIVMGLALLAVTVTMTSPAVGQAPGSADPLGLASVGLVIPFFSSPGNISTLEVASPVGPNHNLQLQFFKADCTLPLFPSGLFLYELTENDIQVINLNALVNFDGLLRITGTVASNPLFAEPLFNPIHARVRWANPAKDLVRTLDPITMMNAEGAPTQTWNPLRTAATFIVPRQGLTVVRKSRLVVSIQNNESTLYLICPPAGPSSGITVHFADPPVLDPPGAVTIHGVVYDADENLVADWVHPCSCLTTVRVQDLSSVYSSPASTTYYTEMFGDASEDANGRSLGSFTGYVGTASGIFFPARSDDFTRLRNGSYQNIFAAPAGAAIDTRGR